MGIHIAASKCPHVHAGVVESVPAALRAITGNGVNVLAMGAFYVAPQMGCDIADAYLNAELGSGYEWWKNFYEFHKLAIDELEAFDYEEPTRRTASRSKHLGDYPLSLETKDDLHFQLRGDDLTDDGPKQTLRPETFLRESSRGPRPSRSKVSQFPFTPDANFWRSWSSFCCSALSVAYQPFWDIF